MPWYFHRTTLVIALIAETTAELMSWLHSCPCPAGLRDVPDSQHIVPDPSPGRFLLCTDNAADFPESNRECESVADLTPQKSRRKRSRTSTWPSGTDNSDQPFTLTQRIVIAGSVLERCDCAVAGPDSHRPKSDPRDNTRPAGNRSRVLPADLQCRCRFLCRPPM